MTRKSLPLLLAALLSLASLVAIAGPAQAAALKKCDTLFWDNSGSYYISIPFGSVRADGWCTMASGQTDAKNEDLPHPVKSLQWALKYCYSRSISADGAFGPATKSALKYAQGKEHVTADGEFGPNTRKVLLWPRFTYISDSVTPPHSGCVRLPSGWPN